MADSPAGKQALAHASAVGVQRLQRSVQQHREAQARQQAARTAVLHAARARMGGAPVAPADPRVALLQRALAARAQQGGR